MSYRKNSPRDPHVYRVPSMSYATGGYNSNSGWKKKIIHNEIDKYTFEQTLLKFLHWSFNLFD